MKRKIQAGTTSFIDRVFVRNTSTTTSVVGLTGLTSGSAGLTLYYVRAGDSSTTAVSLSAGTLGTWSSGGFVEIDSAHMPGWYEVGVPNAAIASGKPSVGLHMRGATNMEDVPWQYELDAVNYQSANSFVTGVNGLAPPTNWNLESIDGSGHVTLVQAFPSNFSSLAITGGGAVTVGTLPAIPANWITAAGVNAAALNGKGDWLLASGYTTPPTAAAIAAAVLTDTTDTGTAGSLGHLVTTAPGWYAAPPTPPTAAAIATAVWTDTTSSDFTTAGSPGKAVLTNLDAMVSTRSVYAGGAVASVTAPVTVGASNDKAGYSLAAAGLDAVTAEAGVNARQALALTMDAVLAKLSGATTSSITIRDVNDTANRATVGVDGSGNRTSTVLHPPA